MLEQLFSKYLPEPIPLQNTPLGMFGGRLGGQMSNVDPLTLYLLQLHEQAQYNYGREFDPAMLNEQPMTLEDMPEKLQEPMEYVPAEELQYYR
jgi:hypothetical protein